MPKGDVSNRQPWTRAEIELLCEAWPKGGYRAAKKVLPHRDHSSLAGKASVLMLRVEGRGPYLKNASTELIDAALKRAYKSGRPNLSELERTTGMKRGWLKYRASVLGIAMPPRGAPNYPWLEEEDKLLMEIIEDGGSAHTIRKKLYERGHVRSLTAIVSRVETLRLNFNRDFWTAADVARMFDLDTKSILRWIDKGWLFARRVDGPSRVRETESDPARRKLWCVSPDSVRRFMLEHPEKWDHRLMKKEILLDLLVPKKFNQMGRDIKREAL